MHSTMIVDLVPATLEAAGSLDQLLIRTVGMGGSDLYLTVGIPPCVRLHGSLAPLPGWPDLCPEDTQRLVRTALTEEQWQRFARDHEMDTS